MNRSTAFSVLKTALALTFLLPAAAFSEALETVQIHGFLSQGYLVSDNNNYLANTRAGSFEFNEVGLNFSVEPLNKLRIGVQLFSRDLGETDNNRIDLDWAFADYHWRDALGIRAGRCKTPMGLYHDAIDLDMVRTSVFLPLTTYDIRLRAAFMSVNGVQAYGTIAGGKYLGRLDYTAFFGTSSIKAESIEQQYALLMDLRKVGIKDIFGGRLIWNTPLNGLLVGGSYMFGNELEARGDITPQLTAPIPMLGGLSIYPPGTEAIHRSKEVTVWFAFLEYTFNKLTVAGEFSRIIIAGDLTTDQPYDPFVAALANFTGLPPYRSNRAGWYAQANYQFLRWLTAGVTYGESYNDWDDREGNNVEPHWNAFQKDTTLSLRFDINRYWNVKLETHFIDGVGLLLLQEDRDTRNWNLYAIKTSIYF